MSQTLSTVSIMRSWGWCAQKPSLALKGAERGRPGGSGVRTSPESRVTRSAFVFVLEERKKYIKPNTSRFRRRWGRGATLPVLWWWDRCGGEAGPSFQSFSFKSRSPSPTPRAGLKHSFLLFFAPSGPKGASSSAQREGAGWVEQCLSVFDSFF